METSVIIENNENKKPKIYQKLDEIKGIHNRNGLGCVEFENLFDISEMVTDEI